MRAKEVARTTGLSVNTVNEHLKSARRKLGTSDSWSAAQLLRALENPTKSSDTNKSGSPRPSIVDRQSVVSGTSVSVRLDLVGRGHIQKKRNKIDKSIQQR